MNKYSQAVANNKGYKSASTKACYNANIKAYHTANTRVESRPYIKGNNAPSTLKKKESSVQQVPGLEVPTITFLGIDPDSPGPQPNCGLLKITLFRKNGILASFPVNIPFPLQGTVTINKNNAVLARFELIDVFDANGCPIVGCTTLAIDPHLLQTCFLLRIEIVTEKSCPDPDPDPCKNSKSREKCRNKCYNTCANTCPKTHDFVKCPVNSECPNLFEGRPIIVPCAGGNLSFVFQNERTPVSFVSPASFFNAAEITMFGAGGGGGSGIPDPTLAAGGGGGGSGFLVSTSQTVPASTQFIINLGAGGQGGTITQPSSFPGGDGGDTTVQILTQPPILLTAPGGKGGEGHLASTPKTGGPNGGSGFDGGGGGAPNGKGGIGQNLNGGDAGDTIGGFGAEGGISRSFFDVDRSGGGGGGPGGGDGGYSDGFNIFPGRNATGPGAGGGGGWAAVRNDFNAFSVGGNGAGGYVRVDF